MSSFTTSLTLKVLDDGTFVTTSAFEYYTNIYSPQVTVVVPAGTTTDFASTPWFMHWIFPPTGKYSKAAVLHDYLYSNGMFPRKDCDYIFLEAMEVLGVPRWKRKLMFEAVRLFGRKYYKKDSN